MNYDKCKWHKSCGYDFAMAKEYALNLKRETTKGNREGNEVEER